MMMSELYEKLFVYEGEGNRFVLDEKILDEFVEAVDVKLLIHFLETIR